MMPTVNLSNRKTQHKANKLLMVNSTTRAAHYFGLSVYDLKSQCDEIKSGQLMCYKTGQFYLLLTDGTVAFQSTVFEVPYELSGQSVILVVDPQSHRAMAVKDEDGKCLGPMTLLDAKANVHRKRCQPQPTPSAKPPTTRTVKTSIKPTRPASLTQRRRTSNVSTTLRYHRSTPWQKPA